MDNQSTIKLTSGQCVEPTNELDCAVTLISLSVSQLFLGVVCGGIATGRVKSPVVDVAIEA